MRAATRWLLVGALALSPLTTAPSGAAENRAATPAQPVSTQRGPSTRDAIPTSGIRRTGAGGGPAGEAGTFLIDRESEPLAVRGPAFGGGDTVRLREVAGFAVTVRMTPVDDDGAPVDGGRVIVLRPNELRSVRLAETLPIEDFLGRRLAVETIRGAGQARVEASWLTPEEAAAVTPHVPRRHLTAVTPPTSDELIDRAEASGTLDHETAVLYHVYAIFGDARLPAAYRGEDSAVFESLYLDTVVSEWATYSAPTQTALKPFLVPPGYLGSWASATGAAGAGLDVHTLDLPPFCCPTCISASWNFKENADGKVRIWYQTAANDDAVAAFLATTADTTIWPAFVAFMGPDEPLSDAGVSCDGGNGRLDVYLTDIDRSYTVGHTGCGKSPAYIVLERAIGAPTLAHEIFHAFQHAFDLQGGGCTSSQSYRWWTEGSATWAEQFLYPNDDLALQQGIRLVRLPESPLDSVLTDIDRVYGTFLVPFYVQHAYFDGKNPTFVHDAWKNCANQDAIHAVDAAIPGGFAQIWPEVALYDWNDKRLTHKNYYEWKHYVDYQAKPQANWTVGAAAQPTWHYDLKLHLGHLSATYTSFDFSGPEIRSVAFFNGASFNLQQTDVPPLGPLWDPQTASPDKIKGVKVQAIVKIEGHGPKVEDWTDRPFVTFCRDMTEERVEDVTIIMSNARLDDTGGKVDPANLAPVFQVSNFGCWQWKGTATYTEPVPGGTQTDTANVTFERVAGPPQPPSITYAPTGTVTVAMSGNCAGGGTVPISALNASLDTYNFAPPGAAALQSYRGESAETAMVDITCQGKPGKTIVGPWFLILAPQPPQFPFYYVSNDGATMSATYILNGLTWHWDLHAQRQ